MVLSKRTIQAIRDYQSSISSKADGMSAEELRSELGISERQLRQLVKAGVVKFSGFRTAISACKRKFSLPCYTVEMRGMK